MSILFKDFTTNWWQTGIFKLSMVMLGIALATTWPNFFKHWKIWAWLIFVAAASYITVIWWRQ